MEGLLALIDVAVVAEQRYLGPEDRAIVAVLEPKVLAELVDQVTAGRLREGEESVDNAYRQYLHLDTDTTDRPCPGGVEALSASTVSGSLAPRGCG